MAPLLKVRLGQTSEHPGRCWRHFEGLFKQQSLEHHRSCRPARRHNLRRPASHVSAEVHQGKQSNILTLLGKNDKQGPSCCQCLLARAVPRFRGKLHCNCILTLESWWHCQTCRMLRCVLIGIPPESAGQWPTRLQLSEAYHGHLARQHEGWPQ